MSRVAQVGDRAELYVWQLVSVWTGVRVRCHLNQAKRARIRPVRYLLLAGEALVATAAAFWCLAVRLRRVQTLAEVYVWWVALVEPVGMRWCRRAKVRGPRLVGISH